jgi:hypothetical protein
MPEYASAIGDSTENSEKLVSLSALGGSIGQYNQQLALAL